MLVDERDALLKEYARCRSLGSWCFYIAIPQALLRRVGVDPLSRRGRLLTGLFTSGWVFSGALLVALVTGSLDESPLLAWLTVAATASAADAWVTGSIETSHEDVFALDTAAAEGYVERLVNKILDRFGS